MADLSDAEIQRLADLAERGYTSAQLRPTVRLTDEQFDQLCVTLDEPDPAPNLERAARRRQHWLPDAADIRMQERRDAEQGWS